MRLSKIKLKMIKWLNDDDDKGNKIKFGKINSTYIISNIKLKIVFDASWLIKKKYYVK